MRSLREWRVIAALAIAIGCALGIVVPVVIASADSGTDGDTAGPILPMVECADLVPDRNGRPAPGVADFAADPVAPTRVTSAFTVPATMNAPAHCVVHGTVTPEIGFRLELPATTWRGRYLQYGCGGFCGQITDPAFPACGPALGGDFAVASTDDGHTGKKAPFADLDGEWAHDQAARDAFNYRAPHLVAAAAKALITAYYGRPPATSYFSGCSDGGREGLLLAQRYPDDFDGVIAGAPAAYWGPLVGEFQAWIGTVNADAAGKAVLTREKLPALHAAVLDSCDDADGLRDGIIDDPRACRFDPSTLRCPQGTDSADCLTEAQVGVVRKLYTGPTTDRGVRLYPGGEQYGSELAWTYWIVPGPEFPDATAANLFAGNYLQHMAFPLGTPHSAIADWTFDMPGFWRLLPEHLPASAMSLDLTAFRDRGGKLILWHGWADPAIPATGTLDYYRRLTDAMGGIAEASRWTRLFMVPGMYHCTGGYGPHQFDAVADIVAWVENDAAPERIVVGQPDGSGGVTRTRPVFPYPAVARYTGSGSVDDAANFVAAPPAAPRDDRVAWAGDWLHALPTPS